MVQVVSITNPHHVKQKPNTKKAGVYDPRECYAARIPHRVQVHSTRQELGFMKYCCHVIFVLHVIFRALYFCFSFSTLRSSLWQRKVQKRLQCHDEHWENHGFCSENMLWSHKSKYYFQKTHQSRHQPASQSHLFWHARVFWVGITCT